jgi:hypothetical protein
MMGVLGHLRRTNVAHAITAVMLTFGAAFTYFRLFLETRAHVTLGHRPADVALAWHLHNPAVLAPIVGPRTRDQLLDSHVATETTLSGEILAGLDESWPGPGGEAPRRTPGSPGTPCSISSNCRN